MKARSRYRLKHSIFDASNNGFEWKPGEYEGEPIDETPRRLKPRVKLYSIDGSPGFIVVKGTSVTKVP